jgi:hypothetical protein
MNVVACTGIFFFGGVSAVLIMGLIFRFLYHPRKQVRDDQFLQEIASALLAGPELRKPAGRLEVTGAETAGTPEFNPGKGFVPGHPMAAHR